MMTCGRSRRMMATSRPTASSSGAMWKQSGCWLAVAVGHARVAVAEHHHLVETDDLGRPGQFERAQLGQQRLLLLGGEARGTAARARAGRVLQVALLAAGAAHEHRAHAFGVVLGQRGRALGGLVVGVGVHGEQAEGRGVHALHDIRCTPAASPLRRLLPVRRVALLTTTFVLLDDRRRRATTTAARCGRRGPTRTQSDLHDGSAVHRRPASSIPTSIDARATAAPVTTLAAVDRRAHRHRPVARRCGDRSRATRATGVNVSPALSWSAAPDGTVEIAITHHRSRRTELRALGDRRHRPADHRPRRGHGAPRRATRPPTAPATSATPVRAHLPGSTHTTSSRCTILALRRVWTTDAGRRADRLRSTRSKSASAEVDWHLQSDLSFSRYTIRHLRTL